MRLSRSFRLAIECAEVEMAVGLERTHTKCISVGEGLLIVRLGMYGVRRIVVHSNLAKEPQGVSFATPFLKKLVARLSQQ